ncbi:lipopolysaccharide assembly protein LapA domain-containing protein [uncultured Pseudodesulfovibrio sp.]|uniref:lipopolysaccharide assembly protein LapA domain-containing protein n=1 Tax=uncultured Pseudodesulfovibrio sp. TaxID=2035858 RepID=UPI003748CC1D
MQTSKPALSLWDKAKAFGMVILLTLFMLFLFQNIQQVEVSFLFWTVSTPRALLLLVTLSIGLIVGYLFAQTRMSSSNRQ